MKQRGQMVDEALDILTGLWRGEPISYRGEAQEMALAASHAKAVQ